MSAVKQIPMSFYQGRYALPTNVSLVSLAPAAISPWAGGGSGSGSGDSDGENITTQLQKEQEHISSVKSGVYN